MITQVDPGSSIVGTSVVVAGLIAALSGFVYLYTKFLKKRDQEKLDSTTEIQALEKLESTTELSAQEKLELTQELKPIILGELLKNTRQGFLGRIQNLFLSNATISPEKLADLEEILYTSDLGPTTVETLMEAVNDRTKTNGMITFDVIKDALRNEMNSIFSKSQKSKLSAETTFVSDVPQKPWVWMIVGVNGVGKTTTIGKLVQKFSESGKKVLVAAGDTFRAAAQDQLSVWTQRAGVEIHSPKGVTDPSAVAYEACEKAKSHGFDVVIVDTAGRLHTKSNLMEELKKMKRVIEKSLPGAPHEVLLVIDANTGQNALHQARTFHEAVGLTGVIMTKLDGTAKGGVAVGIACELEIPILWIGVGEKAQDLRAFSSQEFVSSII